MSDKIVNPEVELESKSTPKLTPAETDELEINKDLIKIINDFKTDLMRTFPDKIAGKLEDINNICKLCKEIYPMYFFDILYKNEEIFNKTLELLPDIDFSELWKENITDATKETIWKYLQLILFSVISNLKSEESFGDTAKLFEAINQDEFKQKIEETINGMGNMFEQTVNGEDVSGEFPNMHIPKADELHDHINEIMEGKLGSLAKEIAEETASDLNIDVDNVESVNDVFKQLFKNPGKLINLVKNVGSKLDNKIKSGEIKESELLEEASDLVSKMKNMPGMDNLENMLSKMGLPGMGKGGKVDMNAFTKHMQQNVQAAKTRDRMRTKLNEKNIEQKKHPDGATITSHGRNKDGRNEVVFSTGDNVEKTAVPKRKKKKAKGKKK